MSDMIEPETFDWTRLSQRDIAVVRSAMATAEGIAALAHGDAARAAECFVASSKEWSVVVSLVLKASAETVTDPEAAS